jgi:hypothetical protein
MSIYCDSVDFCEDHNYRFLEERRWSCYPVAQGHKGRCLRRSCGAKQCLDMTLIVVKAEKKKLEFGRVEEPLFGVE